MTSKELIEAEIETLNSHELDELYKLIKKFMERKRNPESTTSLMSKLQQVKIQAPEDFASNLDLYLSGEKSVD